MNDVSSFRKGQRVKLRAGELEKRPGLRVPADFSGQVLFSGNPYGKGHRTLVRNVNGQEWVPTASLELFPRVVDEAPPPKGWMWKESDPHHLSLVSQEGDRIDVSPWRNGKWGVTLAQSDAPGVSVGGEPMVEPDRGSARKRAVQVADYVRLLKADN